MFWRGSYSDVEVGNVVPLADKGHSRNWIRGRSGHIEGKQSGRFHRHKG